MIKSIICIDQLKSSVSHYNWHVLVENLTVYHWSVQLWHPKMRHSAWVSWAVLKTLHNSLTTPKLIIILIWESQWQRDILDWISNQIIIVNFILKVNLATYTSLVTSSRFHLPSSGIKCTAAGSSNFHSL